MVVPGVDVVNAIPNRARVARRVRRGGWGVQGCAAQPYPQCCSDHCDTLECFAGDINATLTMGFDSYKLDGCGAQRDIELWADMFNHSIEARRTANTSTRANPVGMMIENCTPRWHRWLDRHSQSLFRATCWHGLRAVCSSSKTVGRRFAFFFCITAVLIRASTLSRRHARASSSGHDDDGLARGNAPYYTDSGELWCPFHTYRTSGDARPTYGSLMNNLNSTRWLAEANLSLPGCWAYPDMMEVGVTASTSTMHDCGRGGDELCAPLTVAEARTHFGAWAIVSSPLVLGFDLRNQTMVDLHWDTITNTGSCPLHPRSPPTVHPL